MWWFRTRYDEPGVVWTAELRHLEQKRARQLDAALETYREKDFDPAFRPVVHHFARQWLATRARLAERALDEVIR